jgi:membrane-bound lytic murein transglycosylase A
MRFSKLLWLPLLALAACTGVTTPPAPHSGNSVPNTPATPSSIGNVRYVPVPLAELPEWSTQSPAASLSAFQQSCRTLAGQSGWTLPCMAGGIVDEHDDASIRSFFEEHFDAWRLEDGGRDNGLITGYYEPMLNGSRQQSARTPYPLYGIPSDLVSVDVSAADRARSQLVVRRAGVRWQVVAGKSAPDAGEFLLVPGDFPVDPHGGKFKARVEGNRLLPYYTRAELEAGRLSKAPVLAWVDDATELFFLQIQGSGRIRLDDGSFLHVNAAENNGQPYQSIGSWLVGQGKLSAGQTNMQGIQAWLRTHPEERVALFNRNPRYIFFRPVTKPGDGPLGSLGVSLTGGYSLAVDPRYIPLGAPVYLSTTWPKSNTPLNRLMLAQDTGSAIKGAIRADFFWGYGFEAGQQAGSMKQQGRLWLLLPKGVRPETHTLLSQRL